MLSAQFSLRIAIVFVLVGAVIPGVSPELAGQHAPRKVPSAANGEWVSYAADIKGTRYMPLDQIDASNFSKLEIAWRFTTNNLGPRPEFNLQGTPLMIGRTLYATGGGGNRRAIVAIDAKTGELLWNVNLGGPSASGPISYAVDGKQYVVGTGAGTMFVFALPE